MNPMVTNNERLFGREHPRLNPQTREADIVPEHHNYWSMF